jgi:Fic family protein
MLEKHNQTLELTDWLMYFGEVIIDGQIEVIRIVEFLIKKAKFFDRYSSDLNERQLKVVKRLFDEGHEGFKGELSAKNYTTIANTSASTSTRDLSELVDKKILVKKGQLKSTRYSLNFDLVLPNFNSNTNLV